ncbi:MAG: DUF2293 domain-containing protein [Desulfobulbaceae bacterium]|jgi:hypothetical protein|nr:DUF2293 domain-containing protein [Desulfobulbaceae bacterium]
MAHSHRIVQPSRVAGTVLSTSGEQLSPPGGWDFLPAGDAAVTRSVKSKGATWVVQVKMGRRVISKGIWADKTHILASQQEVAARRASPEYARKRKTDLARREVKHLAYVDTFHDEVVGFLGFHPRYQQEAHILAQRVTDHATPVGSGTVARTERIPVAQRAEAAVIAWMRHQTTAYDSMTIPRVKGRRREVRRHLAAKSIEVLRAYRQGDEVSQSCPLQKVLN